MHHVNQALRANHMFEKGKDLNDLALIIDRVNQIKLDDFINSAVVLDAFEI